jgi:futalosine hydrolase
MRILLVSATAMEVAPAVASLGRAVARGPRLSGYSYRSHDIDLLVCGVGMVAAAAWTARVLSAGSYHVALNFGVCGSFDSAFPPGAVVNVVQDRIAELGAEDGDSFLAFDALGLPDDQLPGPRMPCVHAAPPECAGLGSLPAVTGITVNTVHGNQRSIDAVIDRFRPQVETMEGAGFMYACAIHDLRFAQVRAVSNAVQRRNRAAWKLEVAVEALAPAVLRILETL